MMNVLRIMIGFAHDFAAGGWAATLLAVYWLERQRSFYPEALVTALAQRFFYGGLICIVVILATGAGRTFTYVQLVYGEDAERIRRRMLMGKHLLLAAVFGGGTWWQYATVFR